MVKCKKCRYNENNTDCNIVNVRSILISPYTSEEIIISKFAKQLEAFIKEKTNDEKSLHDYVKKESYHRFIIYTLPKTLFNSDGKCLFYKKKFLGLF